MKLQASRIAAALRPRGHWMMVSAAAIPLLAAIGFHSISPAAQVPKPRPERPAIVFENYFHNYRDIYNEGRFDARFRFFNGGKSPVTIGKIEPSCGCLTPKFDKQVYAPGESGECSIGVLTTHQKEGPNEFTVTVNYADPQPRSATVAFKLNIRRDVTVQPRSLVFYQNGSAESERTFTVSDMRDGHRLQVLDATCPSKLVEVKLDDPVDDDEHGRLIKVHVKVAAKVPAEGQHTEVILTTDDPRYPRIPIPLRIFDTATAIRQAGDKKAKAR